MLQEIVLAQIVQENYGAALEKLEGLVLICPSFVACSRCTQTYGPGSFRVEPGPPHIFWPSVALHVSAFGTVGTAVAAFTTPFDR